MYVGCRNYLRVNYLSFSQKLIFVCHCLEGNVYIELERSVICLPFACNMYIPLFIKWFYDHDYMYIMALQPPPVLRSTTKVDFMQ